jgi:hypothetical protein
MQVVRFQCPCCLADLKIRDDELVGRPINCPDCHQPIVIRLDATGHVSVQRPNEPASPVKKPPKTPTRPPVEAKSPATGATLRSAEPASPSKRWMSGIGLQDLFSKMPAWVAAMLAGLAAVGIVALGFTFWPRSRQPDPIAKVETAAPADLRSTGKATAPRGPVANSSTGQHKAALQPVNAASRLTRLGELLGEYRKRQGNFPSGTTGQEPLRPSERLSWLAELAAGSLFPQRPAPIWIESWNSPRNDRFVRQQIPEFVNPAVDIRVSPQNYPATHFVGVAGVGEDAADLPIDHPRAGIFGNSRTTRLEDIRDGASNTLMVMGVTSDLGSWAAGGSATVRPLTHEPYVNGPDGFGTGSVDRMTVLKADGSVVEMSAATDPHIFRRMAAMADGLPLDATVQGEPGDGSRRPAEPTGPLSSVRAGGPGDHADGQSRQASPGAQRSALPSATAMPETVASRAPIVASRPARQVPGRANGQARVPAVDVAAGLAQHIVRFEQVKPVPLQDVLSFLEELLAVPIRGDNHEIADLDDLLQTPVTFQLENTTVREVLKAVLAKAGLTFEIEVDAIHIRKQDSTPGGRIH